MVVRLDVHLYYHHIAHHREGNEQPAAGRDKPGAKKVERFETSTLHAANRMLLHSEYALHFTWYLSERGRS